MRRMDRRRKPPSSANSTLHNSRALGSYSDRVKQENIHNETMDGGGALTEKEYGGDFHTFGKGLQEDNADFGFSTFTSPSNDGSYVGNTLNLSHDDYKVSLSDRNLYNSALSAQYNGHNGHNSKPHRQESSLPDSSSSSKSYSSSDSKYSTDSTSKLYPSDSSKMYSNEKYTKPYYQSDTSTKAYPPYSGSLKQPLKSSLKQSSLKAYNSNSSSSQQNVSVDSQYHTSSGSSHSIVINY